MGNDIGSGLARSVVYVRYMYVDINLCNTFSSVQFESKNWRTNNVGVYRLPHKFFGGNFL